MSDAYDSRPSAIRVFTDLGELEDAIAAKCVALAEDPELIRSHTLCR